MLISGLIIFRVSSSEAFEGPFINLPASPRALEFLSENKVLIATKAGVFSVDYVTKEWRLLLGVIPGSIFAGAKGHCLLSVMGGKGEFVYCTREGTDKCLLEMTSSRSR